MKIKITFKIAGFTPAIFISTPTIYPPGAKIKFVYYKKIY